jgi:AraC-like DNA-binding protein
MGFKHRYRAIRFGVETLTSDVTLPRHRHAAGYATVVLSGLFEEASFTGRAVVGPGDVLVHADFDCHCNRSLTRHPLQILRLPWNFSPLEGRFAVRDPDELARVAEQDAFEASHLLRDCLTRVVSRLQDWPDYLAKDLQLQPSLSLRDWAERQGLAPSTVSRGFARVFGITPKAFRLETRARHAWNRVIRSNAPLTAIAHELEFADLGHMSRSISALTGHAPSAWRSAHAPRRSSPFKRIALQGWDPDDP